jgi:predicted nuclease of restriction endonuclease-like (RecB) superfamily
MTHDSLPTPVDYRQWVNDVKTRFRHVQIKAAVAINTELLLFYWDLGADIVARQHTQPWGSKFIERLSRDLTHEFPDVQGFSVRNLKYIRQWHVFWSASEIGQQVVAQLTNIPWGHHLVLISKCRSHHEALYYAQKAHLHHWSRAVLTHQIESGLWQREGRALSNFAQTLPTPQSDLAQQLLKDPYMFDFLSLTHEHTERELEKALTEHITHFLLELGAGFAYMGRQVPIHVGEREFFLDLLFYHVRLRCYVVVELKTVDFEPEFAGKLNFYLKAVDEQLRSTHDAPSIGLLLCKHKDKLVAEYALSDINKPLGIATYQLTQTLPEVLRDKLPSIAIIEREMRANLKEMKDDE